MCTCDEYSPALLGTPFKMLSRELDMDVDMEHVPVPQVLKQVLNPYYLYLYYRPAFLNHRHFLPAGPILSLI